MSNDVDAIILNVSFFNYLTNNHLINFQSVGKSTSIGNGYGMLALRKNGDLINRINIILLQMENDGTYVTIYDKYFLVIRLEKAVAILAKAFNVRIDRFFQVPL